MRKNTDLIMKEFSQELLAFQTSCGLSDHEFSGMLIGAAATLCHRAGVPKEHMNLIADQCWDNSARDTAPANQNVEKKET